MRGLQPSPQRADVAAIGWDFRVPHHLFLPEGRAKMREVIKRDRVFLFMRLSYQKKKEV